MRPYNNEVRSWEEIVVDLEKAATCLSRVEKKELESDHDLDINNLSIELQELAKKEKETTLNSIISIGVENFVVNNKEKAERLVESNSLSEKNKIIGQIKNYLQENHNLRENEIPKEDHLIDVVQKHLK